jgi:hypothetical protein
MTALAAQLAGWIVSASPADAAAVRELPGWAELNYYPDEVEAVLARRDALAESASVFTG